MLRFLPGVRVLKGEREFKFLDVSYTRNTHEADATGSADACDDRAS